MLMLMTAAASAASSRRSQWTYDPSPIGSPWTTTSNTPPTVSPADRASSIRAIIAASASGSGQRSGDASASSRDRVALRRIDGDAADLGGERPDLDAELAQERPRDAAGRDPRRRLARGRALEDVAHVVEAVLERAGEVGVAGPDAGDRRRPLVAVGRGVAKSASAASSSSGSTCMTWVQFSQSRLRTSSRIGDPSVSPWRTPARISARSCSIAWRAPRP